MRTLTVDGQLIDARIMGSLVRILPERDIEVIEIQGKNGALIIDNKWYRDALVPWNLRVPISQVDTVLAKLPMDKKVTILDSADNGWCRRGLFSAPSYNIGQEYADIEIIASCDPYLRLAQPDVDLVRNTSNNYTAISNPWMETLPVVEFTNVSGDIHCQFNNGADNSPDNLFHLTGLTKAKVIVDSQARTVVDDAGTSVISAFSGTFPRIWGSDPADGVNAVQTRVYTTMGENVTATVKWEQVKL
jgi:hypothetical protein